MTLAPLSTPERVLRDIIVAHHPRSERTTISIYKPDLERLGAVAKRLEMNKHKTIQVAIAVLEATLDDLDRDRRLMERVGRPWKAETGQ